MPATQEGPELLPLVLKDADLVAWLELVPYSREVHADWVEKFNHVYRPGDDVA